MGSTTSLGARKYRLRQWADQIHDCQNRPRGMTVDAWCEQNGLTKTDYYYRPRQVRQACLDQVAEGVIEQAVVPVPSELPDGKRPIPSADRDQSNSGIEIFCGCFRIHVTEKLDTDGQYAFKEIDGELVYFNEAEAVAAVTDFDFDCFCNPQMQNKNVGRCICIFQSFAAGWQTALRLP